MPDASAPQGVHRLLARRPAVDPGGRRCVRASVRERRRRPIDGFAETHVRGGVSLRADDEDVRAQLRVSKQSRRRRGQRIERPGGGALPLFDALLQPEHERDVERILFAASRRARSHPQRRRHLHASRNGVQERHRVSDNASGIRMVRGQRFRNPNGTRWTSYPARRPTCANIRAIR